MIGRVFALRREPLDPLPRRADVVPASGELAILVST
jgi:hypothetical protein